MLEYHALVSVIMFTERNLGIPNTISIRFPAGGRNLNFLETGEIVFLLHALSFVLEFIMLYPGFIPHDDAI
jgi:hypothetical protein